MGSGRALHQISRIVMKPNPDIQKILLSSPTRFSGEYDAGGIAIAHSWPGQQYGRTWRHDFDGPASRHAFVMMFSTEGMTKEPSFIIPDYSESGDLMCSYLSILFGKRFDNSGSLEEAGFFRIPSLAIFDSSLNQHLPFNSQKPRVDFPVPFDLGEIKRLNPVLLKGDVDQSKRRALQIAGRFYRLALQNSEVDPEVAYLHLITCGETLASRYDYDTRSLLDERRREMLMKLENSIADRALIAFVSESLKQVKRKFAKCICDLIPVNFFSKSESALEFQQLTEHDIEQTVSAAYDLRSRYVHDGLSFGGWLRPSGYQNLEMMLGGAVGQNESFTRLLRRAPTLVGLERILRTCIIAFALSNGLMIMDN